jgi:rfaE bifunctional protein nucleotidyltransferase chain/domain
MRIVLTNGCFDILHPGHLRLLDHCRSLAEGGQVIVALNSDDSVRRLKGPARPIMPYEARRELLMALKSVDAVIGFNQEAELLGIIERLKPAVLVKGPPFRHRNREKLALLAQWGGEYVHLEALADESTTAIAQRLP